MKQAYLLTLIALLTLAGCSTTPVSDADASPVAPNRVLSWIGSDPGPGTGVVIIKRDPGFGAGACTSRVYLNGAPLVDIGAGQVYRLHLPSGDHMFAAEANGICSGRLAETRITVSAGAVARVRLSYGASGEFSIQPSAF